MRFEVWTVLIRGRKSMRIAWDMSWKVPVSIACDATIDVSIERTRIGQYIPGGAELKRGFEMASGFLLINAACPQYVNSRHGNAKPSQETRIALKRIVISYGKCVNISWP